MDSESERNETVEQTAELLERQDAHEKRLRVLMLQAAQHGRNTPAEVLVEIKDIQAEVVRIALSVTKLQISAAKARQFEEIAHDTRDLADISTQLNNAADTIKRAQQDTIELLVSWLDSDNATRSARQRTTNIFYIVVVLMLAIDIILRIFS